MLIHVSSAEQIGDFSLSISTEYWINLGTKRNVSIFGKQQAN